jgi:hypothetical protein
MKTQQDQGAMNRKQANFYATQIKGIYPSFKVSVSRSWLSGGYEVRMSDKDGSYPSVFAYEDSVLDYIRIHTA